MQGHSGKGQLPEVPNEYSQVPQVPQRQGEDPYNLTLVRERVNEWMNDTLTINYLVHYLNL